MSVDATRPVRRKRLAQCHSLRLAAILIQALLIFPALAQQIERDDDAVVTEGSDDAIAPWMLQGGRRQPATGLYKARITPHWFDDDSRFWYRNDLAGGRREFILVNADKGTREPAFEHARLAQALAGAGLKGADAGHLPLERLEFDVANRLLTFSAGTDDWRCRLDSYELEKIPARPAESSDSQRGSSEGVPPATRRTGPETELTFVNRTSGEVELFWIDPDGRPVSYGKIAPGERFVQHTYGGHVWRAVDAQGRTVGAFVAEDDPATVQISSAQTTQRRGLNRPLGQGSRGRSLDGKWRAFVKDFNIFVTQGEGGEELPLTTDGGAGNAYDQLQWSPDSRILVAFRVQRAEPRQVHLIESSPSGGGRAQLRSRDYALPGDPFDSYELSVFDVAERKQTKPKVENIDFGRPRLRWNRDGRRFTYEKTDRGHQRFRVIEVDAQTAESRTIIDETSDTFIWTAHTEGAVNPKVTWLEKSGEAIFVSESDGWRHLYLVDVEAGQIKNVITSGEYVVRRVDRIDEETRQVWFRASGRNSGQDPYLVHYYRVNFDGSNLVALTDGDGSHTIQYSPKGQYVIDTYSRVDMPPVHELRRVSDGSRKCELEKADASEVEARGWQAPEVFTAKGRDGSTDIWGIICRPRRFDPSKKYPVVEDIYAGPQDSFVPKAFGIAPRYEWLTDLGFIVVKIDGMGTANRSKAFHDVCWHNLKDAGLLDRIAWIRAAAERYPYMDTNRVGIFGTSAGGQNAAGAVLFHPEFYKAAVAACGCHDNRMDKASWNEQWMGYPVGPQYSESSNIDNAARLQGRLMLIVGELDTNVPPESTIRFADSLIKAGKDFDLVVVPGANHGSGGAYGRRRTQDFFVQHLLGVEPPNRNAAPATPRVTASEAPSEPARRSRPAPNGTPPKVTAPPESFFELVRSSDRDVARQFYKKYIDAGGLPVVAADVVADEALERTVSIVTHMLAGRSDVLNAMVQSRMYLIVIGRDQVYTDMPEYRNHPNPTYQNERVRGTGGRPTSFGEENLLSLPIDRYDDESIAVHEFCHTIDSTLRSLDSGWPERRDASFRHALALGLWKNTYAASNPAEYWAEICQSYFDCNRVNNWNHGPIGTREQLKSYDPESYELVRDAFKLRPEQDWRFRPAQSLPNVMMPPERFHIDPYYTKFTWAREFPVVGRQASDDALLAANDTIRKMFAYRHDILKALIGGGLKLVVLGRDEKIADLPEFASTAGGAGIDPLARVHEATERMPALVVGEENILIDERQPAGGSDVIRLFARALYHATATRPVDPDWDNPRRAPQQYELRVQRLDVRFDMKLREAFEAAMAAGKWKGTPASRDRVAYWAEGVLAYFDAVGQTGSPNDAPHPITTREALRDYDGGLFAIVNETMAYDGHVDWRYHPFTRRN
jgi:dipeptidyl-peptidase-4